jgi:microcystin-dependent protein
MSEPFLAEIRIVGFNFPPRGWAQCDGQILPINQNQSLYSLLGTTYGGDGRTTFALPDLRSRTPVHEGDGITLGEKAGAETETLTAAQMPAHGHTAQGTSGMAASSVGKDHLLARTGGGRRALTVYGGLSASASQALSSQQVFNVGGGQAHDNMQPFTTLNFVIALQGLFPSRN